MIFTNSIYYDLKKTPELSVINAIDLSPDFVLLQASAQKLVIVLKSIRYLLFGSFAGNYLFRKSIQLL